MSIRLVTYTRLRSVGEVHDHAMQVLRESAPLGEPAPGFRPTADASNSPL